MDSDSLQIISTVISVLGPLIPAIWFLSSKIQKLHGALSSHTVKMEEKISNLERQMNDVSAQLAEARKDTNDLRERVVILETKAG